MLVKTVEELIVYQIAFQLAIELTELVKKIPHHWNIAETDQILRSSSSVSSNIAEGFAQRFYPKQFIRYLYLSIGSSDESKNHLKKLIQDGHINTQVASSYIARYKDLSIRPVNLINYLRKRYKI